MATKNPPLIIVQLPWGLPIATFADVVLKALNFATEVPPRAGLAETLFFFEFEFVLAPEEINAVQSFHMDIRIGEKKAENIWGALDLQTLSPST